jgi:predicted acylesterase/phospholipase RssA
MPGMVAKRHNPVIIAMAKRLEQRGLAPKAIVGASMGAAPGSGLVLCADGTT